MTNEAGPVSLLERAVDQKADVIAVIVPARQVDWPGPDWIELAG